MYIVPSQWGWVLALTGLSAEETAEAAWAIEPDGTQHRGAAAISVTFDALIGFGRIIYFVYRLPAIRQIEDWVYLYVSKNRMVFSRWFSTTPAMKQAEWKPEL